MFFLIIMSVFLKKQTKEIKAEIRWLCQHLWGICCVPCSTRKPLKRMWDCLGTNLPILPFHMLCPPGLTFGKWSASLQQERKGQAPGKPKKFNHFILRAEESSRQRQKSSVQQQQTNFCYWWEHQGQVETIPQEIMSSSNYKRQRERKATLLHIVYLLSCLS